MTRIARRRVISEVIEEKFSIKSLIGEPVLLSFPLKGSEVSRMLLQIFIKKKYNKTYQKNILSRYHGRAEPDSHKINKPKNNQ